MKHLISRNVQTENLIASKTTLQPVENYLKLLIFKLHHKNVVLIITNHISNEVQFAQKEI